MRDRDHRDHRDRDRDERRDSRDFRDARGRFDRDDRRGGFDRNDHFRRDDRDFRDRRGDPRDRRFGEEVEMLNQSQQRQMHTPQPEIWFRLAFLPRVLQTCFLGVLFV